MAVLLSLDPGTSNYGYAVVSAQSIKNNQSSKMKVLRSGRIHTTVRALNKGVLSQTRDYSNVIRGLMDEYKVTHVIAERYMSRRMGGTTIEAVNLMIGVIIQLCVEKGIHFLCIPASQWKNEINRNSPGYLEEEYRVGRQTKITPHTIDASMIALYGVGVMSGQNPFSEALEPGRAVRFVARGGPIADIGVPFVKPKKRKRMKK